MNSLHDAVQSRNGPAEAAANGERNADATSGWRCHAAMAAGHRRPGRSLTAARAGAAEDCRSISRKLYLFITDNNLTEFVSFNVELI